MFDITTKILIITMLVVGGVGVVGLAIGLLHAFGVLTGKDH